jgi:SAM-dependent methyltransferase
MDADYRQTIKDLVLDGAKFVRLTLEGKLKGHEEPIYRKTMVRPVLIKNRRHLQFSYFTAKQDITKNYAGSEIEAKLDEALASPYSTIRVQTADEDVIVQITKKGQPIFHRTKAVESIQKPDLSHDASKDLPLPAGKPDPYLETIGIMNSRGEVKPSMQGKLSQINEFLKLLEHTGELDHFKQTPVNILDCGCGSAYLSFATYHYLNDIRGIAARLVGVDYNESLIAKDKVHSQELGFVDACFTRSSIIDYKPDVPPDIVLALHACDTATDEAIFQGIRAESQLILCAPCCHHYLNERIQAVEPFRPVLRHGILKQRMADILTDSFRALILRILGYKTDVVEFVSSEHTDRNLMIRAVKRADPGDSNFVQEYLDLKAFWGVTPYLETLLGEQFSTLLNV